MKAGRPALAPMYAATLAGMYGSRFPFAGVRGYQSCITNVRGSRPFDPGSCRDRSTSARERVPTGYGPLRAGMTSLGATVESRVLEVVVADAVAAATIATVTTAPTT